MIHRVEI